MTQQEVRQGQLHVDLRGTTAVITGAFSGFGRHFSALLALHGATVAMVGRRVELGRTMATEVGRNVQRDDAARAFQIDVTSASSVEDCFARISDELGTPSIVVNNAGVVVRRASLELSEQDWVHVIDVNLSGVWRVAQAMARTLVAAGRGGSIINIASILGVRVRTQVAPYVASKAGVVHMTRALALEWAPHGIRVNAIAPGYFDTDLTRDFLTSDAGKTILARVPQARAGVLTELDGPLLLLASDASSYITGATIPVDGGHLVSTL